MELEEEQDSNVEFVEDFSDLDEDDLEDCARRALLPCHVRALITRGPGPEYHPEYALFADI
jgi:hypothetical protein